MKIYDPNGDLIAQLKGSGESGVHVVTWDLIPEGSEMVRAQYGDRQSYVAPGVFTIVLTTRGHESQSTLTVLKQ